MNIYMEGEIPVKRYWWWVAIIGFVVISRIPSFFTTFVNIDENEYAIAAGKILAGGLPYKDFLIYQPPVIYYFYALAFWLFGNNALWGVHVLLIAFVATSAVFIYFAARDVARSERAGPAPDGARAGLLAAFYYVVLSFTFLPQDMLAANCEILAVLPIVASVWLYVLAEDKGWLYIASGLFAGIAFLTKYQCGIILAPIIFSIIFSRRKFKPLLMVAAGFVFSLLVVYYLLVLAGAGEATNEALNYIFRYAKGPPQNEPLYIAIKFAMRTGLFVLGGLGIWYLAVRGMFERLPHRFFLMVWLLSSFVPVVTGGRIYFHYYFVVIPAVCVIAAVGLTRFGLNKYLKWGFVLFGIIPVIGFLIYDSHKPFRRQTVKDDWQYAVKYLRENGREGESLFIWGYCPQIYVGSGLPAATRFTTADYLTGRTPATAGLEYDPLSKNPPSSWQKVLNDFRDPAGVVIFDTSDNIFPKAWDYLKEDFARRLPTYIVDTAPSNYRRYGRYPIERYPFLSETMAQKYYLLSDIKGYKIYKVKE